MSLITASVSGQAPSPSVQEIVDQSASATYRDWEKAPGFDFCELDRDSHGTKTYQVLMIDGSSYNRLVAVNGKPLSPEMQERETEKVQERQSETAEEERKGAVQYEKERRRDQRMLEEFTGAMDYTLSGTDTVDGHSVYVVDATPRSGYVPKNMESKAFSAMHGTLWIDQTSFRWVKAQAEVIRPVMIVGFIARIEPGTEFEFEEKPINDSDTWLASHFSVRARAKLLLVFPKSSQQNETYFHYAPSGFLPLEACTQQ
jgi:hypothetical protein